MNRALMVGLGALALLLATGDVVGAQEAWPQYGGDALARGPGNYLSWPKLIVYWLVFAMWVYSTDWVSRDAVEIGDGIGMPYKVWNPIVVFTFLGVFLIVGLLVPIFGVSLLLVLAAYVGPLATYIVQRNSRVPQDKKVLTPAHISNWFSSFGSRKKKKATKMAYEQGAQVEITATAAATESENQSNLISARQSPGYLTAKEILADAYDRRAERIMLDYTQDAVGVRYEIDGIWHNLDPREREDSDVMLAVLKKIANLNVTDRRSRQESEFRIKYKDEKTTIKLASQGTQTGERVVLQLVGSGKGLQTLEQLGMREKMRERLCEALAAPQGFVLLSGLPHGGLTTTLVAALNATDRMLRDFTSIQDESDLLPYVENLEVNKYNAAAGQTPDQFIKKLALKQPEAFVVPTLPNAETVRMLCEEVLEENRLVIATVQAKEAVEGLLRVLLLKAPPQPFAKAVSVVLNQRLVRRLCEKCKLPYEPPPQLLQRLGIPQGRVQHFYREWQPPAEGEERPKEPEVCPECGGVGYKGRVAIFELLVVDEQIRAALVSQPKLEVLRQVARQAGHRTLQEEGILLVAQGVTSLNELQRVMKA